MTTPNIPLLRQVREQIERHPETWNQGLWFGRGECGTTACVAGWAALLAGGKRIADVYLEPEPDDRDVHVRVPFDIGRPVVHVEYRAQRVLGIDSDTAEWLFNGDNSLVDVLEAMDEIEASANQDTEVPA